MLKFDFKNTAAARRRIEFDHTHTAPISNISQDEELRLLIHLIVSKKPSMVPLLLDTLTREQIHKVSGYLCFNIYEVKLDNILHLLDLSADQTDWELIYSAWLRQFQTKENRTIIREFLAVHVTAPAFTEYITSQAIPLGNMHWINSPTFDDEVCKLCAIKSPSIPFQKSLVKHGVLPETNLYHHCIQRFFLFCSRRDYLNETESYLISIFGGYPNQDRRKFISNLLHKLELQDLRGKKDLYQVLEKAYTLSEYRSFLDNEAYRKLQQWKQIITVEIAFNEDTDPYRKEFWIPYAIQHEAKLYPYTLVIDFGEYIAVEFTGKAAGPVYLYSKLYYKQNVEWRMQSWTKGKFQSWEYQEWQKVPKSPGLLMRDIHNPPHEWESRFRFWLARYKIYSSHI